MGSQGGAEALAIVLQLNSDVWVSGSLNTLSARIKVDDTGWFGMIKLIAVTNSAGSFLSKHAAVARWKERALFFVEQEEVKTNANRSRF